MGFLISSTAGLVIVIVGGALSGMLWSAAGPSGAGGRNRNRNRDRSGSP